MYIDVKTGEHWEKYFLYFCFSGMKKTRSEEIVQNKHLYPAESR